MTEAQRKATLRDGQDAGEMLLDIEARIGELLPSAEAMRSLSGKARGDANKGITEMERTSHPSILPAGMTSHRAQNSRAIRDNPAIVAKIKAPARPERLFTAFVSPSAPSSMRQDFQDGHNTGRL